MIVIFFNKFKKNILIGLLFILLAIVAIGVWYSPVIFKGYSAQTIGQNALLGRNVAETDFYAIENKLNITLAPSLLKEQGRLSTFGNKLTSIFYGKLFQKTGIPNANNLLLLSILLYALTFLIFTITIYYLFDLKVALVFAILYIFMPFNWYPPYHIGNNEFALLIMSLFFLFFFLGEKQEKHQCNYFIISGLFLAISGMTKEAMFLVAPAVFLYMLIKNRRSLLYVFIPFLALVCIFWLPKFKENAYIQFYSSEVSEIVQGADFPFYSHAFPDPYTYHYENKEFLQEYTDTSKMNLLQKLERLKVMQNMGIKSINIFERIFSGSLIILRHISRFISFEDIGGPFIFLLLLLGLYVLNKENKNLSLLLIYWILEAVFFMAFIAMAIRNHFSDFNWAVVLLVTLGTIEFSKIIAQYLKTTDKKRTLILAILVALIAYNLVSANHVMWSRIYDNNSNLIKEAYNEKMQEMDITDSDIIAVSFGTDDMCYMSYLNKKSYVTFRESTIEKLIDKGELQSAFDTFGVKYILGYSDGTTKKIVAAANIINISSSSIKPIAPELSRSKSWLMNVVK